MCTLGLCEEIVDMFVRTLWIGMDGWGISSERERSNEVCDF